MSSRTIGSSRRFAAGAAALALVALVLVIGAAGPAVALEQPDTIDLETLDMVPVRMWGVSGQNPSETQTETLDVLVYDFAQSGEAMFVGGAFLNVQQSEQATPIPQAYVAAFDIHTGAWIDTWTPTIDRAVYSLEVLPNGSLLVGGEFETVNGVGRRGLVALDPITGAIDPSFSGAVDRPWSSRRATVRDMVVERDSGRIYVAGNFSHLDGAGGSRTQVSKVGRFSDAWGTIDASWKPQVGGGAIWGLDTDPGRGEVALSGFFTSVAALPDTGHFEVVDDVVGAVVAGKAERQRNYPASQPEVWDVVYGNGLVFAIGEQHIIQVLRADDHVQLGYHHTGYSNPGFAYSGGFAGGAYQAGEKIGNIVLAGCHCTSGSNNHFESFTGRWTTRKNVMAYDASTGRHIEAFNADIESPRDGFWAAASSTDGCLYLGGDFHLGGTRSGRTRWLGGFAKLCSPRPTNTVTNPGSQATLVGQPVSLQLEAQGRADLTLTYEATGLPSGLVVDRATGLITGTPHRAGSSTVRVVVGDDAGISNPASFSFDWSVLGIGPPIIRPIADTTVIETDPVSIAVGVEDGRAVTFEAEGLPDALTIDDRTGLISGPAEPDGVHQVTVRATDALGRVDVETFTLTVLAWTPAPAVTSYHGYTTSAGSNFVGWQFTVDRPMTIVELGVHDADRDGVISNDGSTTVGLYDKAGRNLLGRVDVAAGAPIEQGFAYGALAQPIEVTPGNTYVVAAEASGERYASGGTIEYGDGVSYAGYAYKKGSNIGWPSKQGTTGPNYFGATFRTESERPVVPGGGGAEPTIEAGSQWRYDDTGTDRGVQWRAVAVDDGGWPRGPGSFGFGDGVETTSWTPGHTTYYARTTFEFSGPIPPSLDIDLQADDGAVVYLNGVEILRDNMPAGIIRFDTTAAGWRVGLDEGFHRHVVSGAALVEGTNVLAVEIHNIWAGGSDLGFDLEMRPSDSEPDNGAALDLIPAGSDWRHGDSSNGVPVNWKQGLPADRTGTAEFGFGDGDESTVLAPGQDAYYFTLRFTVGDPGDHPQLSLGLAADDGAVVYLNGVEVQRVNMPDGPIAYDTRPSSWAAGPDERMQEYTITPDALVPGINTMAVEVHNLWPGNSDLSFDLRLR